MPSILEDILTRWACIGAALGVAQANRTPDLERLIIDTAHALPESAHLLRIAANWLAFYPYFVARHRLARLVGDVESDTRSRLGLLLDAAVSLKKTAHFNDVIRRCRPAAKRRDPQPLLLVQRRHEVWRRVAERESSPLGRRWGYWCQPVQLKRDAIRPARWITLHNPDYVERAVFGGDLRLTILIELREDPTAGESELALARRCGAQRAAVRHSLDLLEAANLVERVAAGKRVAIRLPSPHITLRAA